MICCCNIPLQTIRSKILMINDPENTCSDQWSIFEQGLDTRHQDFVVQLARLCPALSHNEIRICLMISIDLGTHEIAMMLNVSERNIESCRRAIRKKLAIRRDVPIKSFLESTIV